MKSRTFKTIEVSRDYRLKRDARRCLAWMHLCNMRLVTLEGSRGYWLCMGLATAMQLAAFASLEAQYESDKAK